ncbi:hypothetical protein I549_2633 [Mycobacterium avium subsp. avium 2285 (R)]|nr:hypothetical protein I549_2633 [Mycobacterium avium subsp. avium 2285 (R)]
MLWLNEVACIAKATPGRPTPHFRNQRCAALSATTPSLGNSVT